MHVQFEIFFFTIFAISFFFSLLEVGWKARVSPVESHVSEYEFDVLVGADGKRNTLQGIQIQ